MPSSQVDDSVIYDLIGLGFGPANLAIAGAVIEQRLSTSPRKNIVGKTLFIEKHEKFRWHPGMLLPDARMQISFMKDLATLRNPQSPITFLSYLHSQDRLISFINRGSTIPSRKEYADYLSWAARFVQNNGVDVLYGHEVIRLSKGSSDTIEIHSRNVTTGAERVVKARDIIISPGGAPRIPDSLSPIIKHPFVIHSSSYATSIGSVLRSLAPQSRPLRVAVVGSGQSAAEVTLDLRERLGLIPCINSRHEVDMIIRKGSLKPSDDSPFANEIFDPSSTDIWFNMPSDRVQSSRLSEYKSTNYGVVNPRTLEVLHEVIYDQKLDDGISKRTENPDIISRPYISILPYSSIISTRVDQGLRPTGELLLYSDDNSTAAADNSVLTIVTQNFLSHKIFELKYDAIVYATGYQRSAWVDLLKGSNIGKRFGLHEASSSVRLLPSSRRSPRLDVAFDMNGTASSSETSSPSSHSACSTPPTSPGPSAFSSIHIDHHIPDTVYISRSYQLLATQLEGYEPFKPRIYLQGVEEATHGLSDTLLSVLGVRAGEVVNDLCHNRGYQA